MNSSFNRPAARVFLSLLIAGCVLTGISAHASGVILNIDRPLVTNDFSGKITLTITGLMANQTVLVEKYVDLNGNGIIDAGQEGLVRSFTVTDGQLPLIGGVRNLNVPGDDDGAANSSIQVQLDFPGVDTVFGSTVGKFVYRVSDPVGPTTLATATFEVKQKAWPQGVSGRISALTGDTSLGGAFVALAPPDGSPVAASFTDANGNYQFNAPTGSYVIYVVKTGYVTDSSATSVTVVTNQFATKNLALASGGFTIAGKLSDSSSGAGIPGIFVNAESTNNLFAGAVTDANGDYSFAVTASQWKVKSGESSLVQLGYLKLQNKVITNTPATGSATINFSLPKATALVYGSVKDSLNNPVNALGMSANDQGNLYGSDGRTFSPNGNYTLGVAAGTWSVGPEPDDLPARGYTGGSGTNVSLTSGQALLVNFILSGVTTHLRGQIKDDSGAPITNMSIVVQPVPMVAGGAASLYPKTDSNGNFDVGVRAGTWNINLECVEGQNRGLVGVTAYNYTVADGVDQIGLVLSFPKSTFTITGTVKDSSNIPIVGVQVDASANNNTYLVGCTPTDANGFYTLKVINSSWTVSVRADDLNAHGFNSVNNQTVSISGANGTANFVASPLPVPVTITTPSVPNPTQGTIFNTTLNASGGSSPYNWEIVSGWLPSGLLLNSGSGQISGTPGESGSFTFNVAAADSLQATGSKSFSMTVNAGSFPSPYFTNGPTIVNGKIQFKFSAVANQTYAFEASTDLKTWTVRGGFTATTNLIDFSGLDDPMTYNYRFYRARIGRLFKIQPLAFHHYASGGNFGALTTPTTSFPISMDSYTANFEVGNDPNFPMPANVFFTGPGGSGLNNSPANAQNSRVQAEEAGYQSPNVVSPAVAPSGTWTVNYHGTNVTFNMPNPQAASRLVIPVPTMTVASGNLTGASWVYKDPTTGVALSQPPSYMVNIQLQVDDQSLGRVYNSTRVTPNITSVSGITGVNWNNVGRVYLVYDDTLGNHYVVSFSKP